MVVILSICATCAWAEAPQLTLRPLPRPQSATIAEAVSATATSKRPRQRPDGLPTVPVEQDQLHVTVSSSNATKPSATRKGSVCNNPEIKGMALKPIKSRIKGCNVKDPVQVTSVNGVRLNPAATLNCDAAGALAEWIDEGLQPAFNNRVVQLNIATSYACRPRNNVRGAKISEHGSGNAIDISGFVLGSGKTMTVARNYGAEIKKAKKAACGTFRTTLGPGSDGYHEDHIHLDISQRRGNPYCR